MARSCHCLTNFAPTLVLAMFPAPIIRRNPLAQEHFAQPLGAVNRCRAQEVGVAPLVLVPTAEQAGPPVESCGSVVRRHLADPGYHRKAGR